MTMENYRLKWGRSRCIGKPSFITEGNILVPCENFLKIFDVEGRCVRTFDSPKKKIACATSMPSLGVIAFCDRSPNPKISVLEFPEMKVVSECENASGECIALNFTCLQFLLSVNCKVNFAIELWRWSTGQKLCTVIKPLLLDETFVDISVNPTSWYKVCLQTSVRLTVFDVKSTDDKWFFKERCLFLLEREDGNYEAVRGVCMKLKDGNLARMICHCWIPHDHLLVSSSIGLIKVNPSYTQLAGLKKASGPMKIPTSMALSGEGLFVGYEDGKVEVLNISEDCLTSLNIIDVAQSPINSLSLCPSYETLVISSQNGAAFLYRQNGPVLKTLINQKSRALIGICLVGSFSNYCALAYEDGTLSIYSMLNGEEASSILIEEDIKSVDSSPLCSLVVLGSVTGFMYCVDVTDPSAPRIVYCDGSSEAAIEFAKFDNFGRYILAASSSSQNVCVWSGTPSSGFQSIGFVHLKSGIKDVAAFAEDEKSETCVFVLLSQTFESDKDVLIQIKLPRDVATDFRKYQVNGFGTLDEAQLTIRGWTLDSSFCGMQIHGRLGAVLYSKGLGKVTRFPVWPNSSFENDHLMIMSNVTDLKVSPNQRWLGATSDCGCLQLCSTGDETLMRIRCKLSAHDKTSHHFLSFSGNGNCVVLADATDEAFCYELSDFWPSLDQLRNSQVHCILNREKEEGFLQSMDREDGVATHSAKSLGKHRFDRFRQWVGIAYFRLKNVCNYDTECPNERNYTLHENKLQELFVISGHAQTHEENIRTIYTTSMGISVQNYTDVKTDGGDMSSDSALPLGSNANKGSETCSPSELKEKINHIKIKFNTDFDRAYEEREKIITNIFAMGSEARSVVDRLPSKAERDFWGALLSQSQDIGSEFERLHSELQSESSANRSSAEEIPNAESADSKDSLQNMYDSIQSMKSDLNAKVERLWLEKRYYNYIIFICELRIYCVILLLRLEKKFRTWEEEIRTESETVVSLSKGADNLIQKTKSLNSEWYQLFCHIQITDRKIDSKVGSMCSMLKNSDEVYLEFEKSVARDSDRESLNPFWKFPPLFKVEDLLEEEDRSFCNVKNIDDAMWEKISKRQTHHFRLAELSRHIFCEAMEISTVKSRMAEHKTELEKEASEYNRTLDGIQNLKEKSRHVILAIERGIFEHASLGKASGSIDDLADLTLLDSTSWSDIGTKLHANVALQKQLADFESSFEQYLSSENEMRSRSNRRRLEFIKHLKDMNMELQKRTGRLKHDREAVKEIMKECKKKKVC